MPDLDPLLAHALKAAKKKPHNFVYVIGSKDKVLLASRTKVPANDVKDARERAGGSVVIKGICRSDGEDGLLFETTAKTGGTLEKQLKASIKMQAGLSIKVSVAEKDAVDEVDEAPEQVTATTGSSGKSNPVEGGEGQEPAAEVDPRLVSARATYKNAVVELAPLLQQLHSESAAAAAALTAKVKEADPRLAKPVATLTAQEAQAALQKYTTALSTVTRIRATAEEQLSRLRSGKTTDASGAARARAATLAKLMKEELATALTTADESNRKAIEAKRSVIQTAVNGQQWEEAITAIEDLRGLLRQLSGTPTPPRSQADQAVLQRARETWRDDVYQRLDPVRTEASTGDGKQLDTLRDAVETALQDQDMAAAGRALEALDEAIAAVAEATRRRHAHEQAVRERRERADILLAHLEKTRARANPTELRRIDSLRFPISEAFERDDLTQIDSAVEALEHALAEVDPAISERDRRLTERLRLANERLDTAKSHRFKLAIEKLDRLGVLIPQHQKAGDWDKAEKAMASIESLVDQLTQDLALALLLDDDIDELIGESAVQGGDFDLRQIRRAFEDAVTGDFTRIGSEVAKVRLTLTSYSKKQANKAKAGPSVPPEATDVQLDYSSGRPMLPGSGIFLSVEMQNNQTGSRGAEHVVPLDVLDYAAKKCKGKTGATDGGNPAFYLPVGPGKSCSKFLCIVIAGNTMITSYTIAASAMMRKLGLSEDQLRTWAANKAYTRAF